jgi:hypothetical protein
MISWFPIVVVKRAGPNITSGLVQYQNCQRDDSNENVAVTPQAQYLFSEPHKPGLSVIQLEAILGQLEEDLWRKGGQSIGEVGALNPLLPWTVWSRVWFMQQYIH